MHGLALLGTYIVVALAGQAAGFWISSLVERTVPSAGLLVVLAFFLVCWLSPGQSPLRCWIGYCPKLPSHRSGRALFESGVRVALCISSARRRPTAFSTPIRAIYHWRSCYETN